MNIKFKFKVDMCTLVVVHGVVSEDAPRSHKYAFHAYRPTHDGLTCRTIVATCQDDAVEILPVTIDMGQQKGTVNLFLCIILQRSYCFHWRIKSAKILLFLTIIHSEMCVFLSVCLGYNF